MRKSGFPVLLALLLVVLLGMCAGAQAETKKFSGASEAIKWIKKNQPEELTVEGKFKPADLLKVKNAMPEGSEFHFRVTWGDVIYTDESTEIILGGKKAVSEAQLEAIISLCPNIRLIDNSKNQQPSNDVMIPLMEKYPDIRFEWVVNLRHQRDRLHNQAAAGIRPGADLGKAEAAEILPDPEGARYRPQQGDRPGIPAVCSGSGIADHRG